MGVSMTWDEARQHIILLTFTEEWTWREAMRQLERSLPILEQATPIFFVVDMLGTTYLPSTGLIETVKQAAAIVKPYVQLKGAILVMRQTPMRDMLLTAMTSYGVRGHTFHVAPTLDDAYALVTQVVG
jgi:hypothetical protein